MKLTLYARLLLATLRRKSYYLYMNDHRHEQRVDHHIHLHLDHELARPLLDAVLRTLRNTEELKQMSGTNAERVAAAQAETNAKLDALTTNMSEIGADVDSLLAGMNPGDQITPEMVAAAESIRDRVGAANDGLSEINAKVPPVAPSP